MSLTEQARAALEKVQRIADWDGEHPDEAGEWMQALAREAAALLAPVGEQKETP
jgi:hypothetical protein